MRQAPDEARGTIITSISWRPIQPGEAGRSLGILAADAFAHDHVGFWLSRRGELEPRRVAIEYQGQEITYGELDERANRCANLLEGLGVGHGERVAVLSRNRVEHVEVFFACAKLRAIFVPLNFRLAVPELEFLVNDCRPAALVAEHELAPTATALRPLVPDALAVGGKVEGFADYEEAMADSPGVVHSRPPATPDDVLGLFYTGGTTEQPKGAMLTHNNIFWTNLNILLALDLSRHERSLMVLPMANVAGWNINTLSVWWKGGTVLLERDFDPDRCLDLIEQRRVTSVMGVPTVYLMMSRSPRFPSADLSSLRFVICGGAPTPEPVIRTWEDRGVTFVQAYGLTEAGPNVLCLPPEDTRRKAGFAGKPYFYTDVRLKEGSGEVLVRGPSVMKGYWHHHEAVEASLPDGWLHSGDVAVRDEEGYHRIVDRVGDVIITGGENVFPTEVENVLYEHPAVEEATVVGVPDERWGESVSALVVVKPEVPGPSEKELVDFCRSRLARYKVPRSILFADHLPRTASGNVLRHVLVQRWSGPGHTRT